MQIGSLFFKFCRLRAQKKTAQRWGVGSFLKFWVLGFEF